MLHNNVGFETQFRLNYYNNLSIKLKTNTWAFDVSYSTIASATTRQYRIDFQSDRLPQLSVVVGFVFIVKTSHRNLYTLASTR